MAGGYGEAISTGVREPVIAKAMVIEQGTAHVAIVLNDLTGVSEPLTTRE